MTEHVRVVYIDKKYDPLLNNKKVGIDSINDLYYRFWDKYPNSYYNLLFIFVASYFNKIAFNISDINNISLFYDDFVKKNNKNLLSTFFRNKYVKKALIQNAVNFR